MTIAQLPPFDLRVVYPWMQPDAVFAAHFEQGQYWLDDAKGPIAASSLLTTTRSSSIVLPDSAGVFQPLGNNTLPRTDRGLYVNGQRTNKNVNYNANPVDLSGIVKGGDPTATLTVVDDTAALAAAGLQNICTSGKVLKFDNSAGAGFAVIFFNGFTGNMNQHVFSAFTRVSGGSAYFRDSNAGNFKTLVHSEGYIRQEGVFTPASDLSRAQIYLGSSGGTVVYFILNQLEEAPFAGPPIVVSGSGATLMASDIRAVQGVRPSNSQPEPFPGWEAAGLDDGLTVLLDFENRVQQAAARQVVSLTDASNATVAVLDTSSDGTSFRLTAGGGSDIFPGSQTGGRSRAACRIMPDGAFALAQKGQGSVITGTKVSPINLASAALLSPGNRPQLDTPWNDWIYALHVCKPLSDAALLDWVNAA